MIDFTPFSARPAPWQRAVGLPAVLQKWEGDRRVAAHFVLSSEQPARQGSSQSLPPELHPRLVAALQGRGIDALYDHQAQAFALARAGQDVVVATPTASGKSLCYNLPVLQQLCEEPQARALYLFPTKALARDQEEALHTLLDAANLEQGAITYDGDTPADARRAARERSGLLLTNPDMLHSGILPHHANWARFFANLRYIVLDELHIYRGVFGSHVVNVLRRLVRIAAFHGARPTFLFASATLGNAADHASRMAGRPVTAILQSGAPAAERHVRIYNPPVVNQQLGIRQSSLKAVVRLALDLIEARVTTLIFGQSRNNVEVILKYLRDRLAASPQIDPQTIQSYRGGYLPQARRRIEAGLRRGEILCVVATNALELGIDIGALDAVICAGYPGSVAGLWQRFGRGGRRGSASLALLVTNSAPLDQYWALAPEALVAANVEQARTDPDNVEILVQHLKCAAFELPFVGQETFGNVAGETLSQGLNFLTDHRVVHPVVDAEGSTTYHWATDAYPAKNVSLRQMSWDNFVIIDVAHGATIAEMDWRSTHTMLHEQAIYQHAGEQWQVERLDFENRKAYVRQVEPDYYTDAMTHLKITVIEQDQGTALRPGVPNMAQVGFGEISLIEKVIGFKKIKYHTHENVGYGEVFLPEMQMHTTAFWLSVDASFVRSMELSRPEVIDGLRGVVQAMHTVAAVGLMTDPKDLGCTVIDAADVTHAGKQQKTLDFDPTLFLFDRMAGGTGLATRLYEDRDMLLRRARRLLDTCPCTAGCPYCVGPVVLAAPGPAAAITNDTAEALPAERSKKRAARAILGRLTDSPPEA
jgi:DEAD/DEAH box helicase domain-containing protein